MREEREGAVGALFIKAGAGGGKVLAFYAAGDARAELTAFAMGEGAEGAAQEGQGGVEMFGGKGGDPLVEDIPEAVIVEKDEAAVANETIDPGGGVGGSVGDGKDEA